MSVHRIRLHGPWNVRPHSAVDPTGRMTVPGSLQDAGYARISGQLSLHRHFGKPTNLDENEQVWLHFERVEGLVDVLLNGHRLAQNNDSLEWNVTELLKDRNELELVLDGTDDSCGILGNVLLEIRSSPMPMAP